MRYFPLIRRAVSVNIHTHTNERYRTPHADNTTSLSSSPEPSIARFSDGDKQPHSNLLSEAVGASAQSLAPGG